MTPFIVLAFVLVVLATPPALKKSSWLWFFIALVLSFAGVMLPLFIFLFSTFLTPEWKGACHYGWVDCFIESKLVLLPLVLWATAALYAVEILRVGDRTRRWIVLGFFLGAITATVCFVFGVVCFENDGLRWWLLVPFYVAVWYSLRARQLIRAAPFGFWTYLISLVGSLPLWLASWIWSKNIFESLPNQEPGGCFIVTAAGRGHEKCVGPLVEITRHGRQRKANQQLLIFWQLENHWQNRAPRSHRIFRRCYNRIGPVLARQIKSPWQADAVHLAIKPIEFMATLVNKNLLQK